MPTWWLQRTDRTTALVDHHRLQLIRSILDLIQLLILQLPSKLRFLGVLYQLW
jgi:hypothetical protein